MSWIALYKLARLALLAAVLVAIVIWVYRPSRKQRLEAPARRMLEDDDLTSGERAEIAEYERLDHAPRDGIREEDNRIPAWWWGGLWFTVAIAAFYVPYYLLSGWSQETQYQVEVAAAEARAAAVRASLPSSNPFRGDAAAIAEGAQVFATICAACHKPDASGLVGPSLVDPYWKYGHDDASLFETVSAGRPAGMPGWAAQLGNDKIWKVLAYLETLPKSEKPGVGAPGMEAAGVSAAAP